MEDNEKNATGSATINLVPASLIKRITNYLIDLIFFSLLASFLVAFFYPKAIEILNNQKEISLANQLLISFVYGLFMSFTEALFKGKSLGKFITGTRAVYQNGSNINSQTAFVRGLCRIIPFEQLSAIGFPPYPWHDRWSSTIVINEKVSRL